MQFTKEDCSVINQIIEAGTYSGKNVVQVAAVKLKVEAVLLDSEKSHLEVVATENKGKQRETQTG